VLMLGWGGGWGGGVVQAYLRPKCSSPCLHAKFEKDVDTQSCTLSSHSRRKPKQKKIDCRTPVLHMKGRSA